MEFFDKYLKYFTIIFFAGIISFSSAQNCNVNRCPFPKEKYYQKSGMSRAFPIRQKQKRTFSLTMYEGKEYFFSVCGKPPKLGNIQLRILTPEMKLMYDNAAEGLIDFVNIKAESTQKVTIEISAPNGNLPDTEKSCIGFYVAYRTIEGGK